jgi:5'-nucleotidase
MKPNVHLVANFFTFSEDGKIKEIPEHYVHTFNKNEYEISSTPYQKEITKKSNVILLGDSLGDLGMTEGMNHDEVIRIGFLNDKIEELLGAYSEKFDVVITEDGSFEEVNEILRKILH